MIFLSDIRVLVAAGYDRKVAIGYAVRAADGDRDATDIIFAAHALRLELLKRMGKIRGTTS